MHAPISVIRFTIILKLKKVLQWLITMSNEPKYLTILTKSTPMILILLIKDLFQLDLHKFVEN